MTIYRPDLDLLQITRADACRAAGLTGTELNRFLAVVLPRSREDLVPLYKVGDLLSLRHVMELLAARWLPEG